MLRILCVLMLLGLFCISTLANEPAKGAEPEKLPPPKMKIDPPIIVMPSYQRTDTREVWQHYGVNAFGRYVPRVIQTPYGAYYSRTLDRYPWSNNRPSAILP
jgi:hypothetical protein